MSTTSTQTTTSQKVTCADDPIAIVGIGCRVPGADGPDAFWSLVSRGVDAIREVPADRWNLDRFHDSGAAPGHTRSRWGGFLDEIDHFDPRLFGISPREAVRMDPQQRLALEVSWRALEDAGTPIREAAAGNAGVFVGVSWPDYWMLQLDPANRREIDAYVGIGGALSIVANRISHAFGLGGPSVVFEAACASSLVAIVSACDALQQRRCDVALAGGVNVVLKPELSVALSQAAMLSPRGRCRAFDAGADGYVRGEGAAMLVLEPLSRAIARRDRIYAVIRGGAVNQDGRTPGITVPSTQAQIGLIEQAIERAGVAPAELAYVEAHGTGTPVGDPREATAIGTALKDGRTHPLRVGSVKTNIGHLEAAAGVAGLVKAALSLHRGQIPPSLHFETPHPEIPFADLRLEIQRELGPWPVAGPRLAGVNSFGFGGTNAHVVVEAAPERQCAGERPRWPLALPVSTRTAEALPSLAQAFAAGLDGADAPTWVHAAATRRDHHAHRAVAVAEDLDELRSELRRIVSATPPSEPSHEGSLAFVFTGMGPQWWAMGQELMAGDPEVLASIERCDALFRRHASWSLVDAMRADEATSRMARTEVAQPANFALQVALVERLAGYGVRPDAIVGHSTGEVAAAWAAGCLDLDDAIEVIFHRSRLQQRTAGTGSMLAVGLPPDEAREAVAPDKEHVSIAAINGPRTLTLAGRTSSLERIAERLEAAAVFTRWLRVDVPYHSPAMDSIEQDLRASLARLTPRPPATGLVSTVFPARDLPALDADYWWHNVRATVHFEEATQRLLGEGVTRFVEVGPHPVLAAAIRETAAARGVRPAIAATLRRRNPERRALLACLGDLHTSGSDVDWSAVYGGRAEHRALPGHPMDRQPHWAESSVLRLHRLGAPAGPFLRERIPGTAPSWRLELAAAEHAYLRDHRVDGRALMPAAAMLEAMLEARAETRSHAPILALADVRFDQVLPLENELPAEVRVTVGPRIELASRDDALEWAVHASARPVEAGLRDARLDRGRFADVPEEPGPRLYEALESLGYQYGPAFQKLASARVVDAEVLAHLRTPDERGRHVLHPALLDAAFQAVIAACKPDQLLLPVGIDLVRVRPGADLSGVSAHVGDLQRMGRSLSVRVRLYDASGHLVADLEGFRVRRLEQRAPDPLHGILYAHRPVLLDRVNAAASPVELPDRALHEIETRYDAGLEQLEQERFEAEVVPDLERLATAYAYDALETLGFSWRARDERVSEIERRLRVAPDHRRLLGRILQFAEADGLLERTEDRVRLTHERTLPSAAEVGREFIQRHPSALSEWDLIRRTGPTLADILRGTASGVEALFSGGSLDHVEHFYEASRTAGAYGSLVREAIASIAAATRGGLDILEIGAGTGATTFQILDLLPEGRCRYLYSDIGKPLVDHGRRRFGGAGGFEYAQLDIERSPADQGITRQFDLVLASNVLHATRDLRVSLQHANSLLRPGGLLLLLEIVTKRRFLDVTFGVTDGWWRFSDDVRSEHALLDVPTWTELLQEAGFQTSVLGDKPSRTMALLCARKRGNGSRATRPPTRDTWWVIEAEPNDGASIETALTERGIEVWRGTAPRGPDLAAQLESSGKPDGVVFAFSGSGGISAAEDLITAQKRGPLAVIELIQALATAGVGGLDGLWLVTSGAVPDERSAHGDGALIGSLLWGLGRVLMNEHPELRPALADLPSAPTSEDYGRLAETISAHGEEREMLIRGGDAFGLRLEPVAPESLARTRCSSEVVALGLEGGRVTFKARASQAPGPGEVEIAVRAAAINFRDALLARGMYPEASLGSSYVAERIGEECAGYVVRVGAGVDHLQPGDRVVALAPGALAERVVARADLVAPIPGRLTFHEAATLPIPYVTAYLALVDMGRIRAGDRVLVHSAASGVGLATLHLARALDASVVATAGSDEKRHYLRQLGVTHVYDSRSPGFGDAIREDIGGVDIVVNALAGEAIDEGLRALAPGGRFVELGKRDVYGHTQVDLHRLALNASFSVLDADALESTDPGRLAATLATVLRLVGDTGLPPLPGRAYPLARALEALEFMASGAHIGRVMVSPDLPGPGPRVTEGRPMPIRHDGTYLVTGGLGGFGLVVARWLAERGAGHVVLVGRSFRPEAQGDIAAIEQLGTRVTVEHADVADRDAVEAILARARSSRLPLRGIFHAAFVLRDAAVAALDETRWFEGTRAKIEGAWHLHSLTSDDPLDAFVLFSSAMLLVGNAGQASYSASNAFLSALAERRRELGQPALAVHWGAISDVGFVARNQAVATRLRDHMGVDSLSPARAIQALESLLARSRCAQATAFPIRWARWASAAGAIAQSPTLRGLCEDVSEPAKATDADAGNLAERLGRAGSASAQRAQLLESLRAHIAHTLRVAPDQIEPHRSLTDAGVDSLMAAELRTYIDSELGVDIPMVDVVQGLNLERLVDRVAEALGLNVAGEEEVTPPPGFEAWVGELANALSRFRREMADRDEVPPAEERDLHDALFEARAELARRVEGLSPKEHAAARAAFRRQLDELLLASAMFRHARVKPLGYPGDHRLMMRIYDRAVEGRDGYARALDRYAIEREPGPRSVRNRAPLVSSWILEELSRTDRPIRVASLGCGPARELALLLEAAELPSGRLELLLIDQDRRALDECERAYRRRAEERGVVLATMQAAVETIGSDQRLLEALSDRDLIYSTGLFDYFADTTFETVLGALYRALRPGGRLLVGNVKQNPSRWVMEYVLDWFIHHRDGGQLEALGRSLSPAPAPVAVRVEAEAEGLNLFLHVQKPSSPDRGY